MVDERIGQPQLVDRRVHSGLAQHLTHPSPDPSHADAVLDRDDEAMGRRELDDARLHGHDPSRVDHGRPDALRTQTLRDVHRELGHRADADEQNVLLTVLPQHVRSVGEALDRRELGRDGTLRETNDGRRIGDGNRFIELLAQPSLVARSSDADAGDELQHRQVPDPVVARAVGPRHSGAVEDEGDAGPVEGDIHHHLIERAVHECRVDRDDGVEATEGESRGGGDGVLLRDAHVVHAIREALCERLEPGGAQHRRGDGDDVLAALAGVHERLSEDVGPPDRVGGSQRLAGRGVDLADRVELVRLVVAGRIVPTPLLRDDVHDHRRTIGLREAQGLVERTEVVPVDRAQVLDVEVGVQRFVVRETREEPVRAAAHSAVDGASGGSEPAKERIRSAPQAFVALRRADTVEIAGHAADRRSVGPAVIVHDDDEVALIVV